MTKVAGLYATWLANYDAKPSTDASFDALLEAENTMADTPAECIGDVLLKLKAVTEQDPGCDIFPVMVESVVRDLERMNKRPLANAA